MKRGFVVAVGGAAIVVAGLAGCSSKPDEGTAKVTVDGKDIEVKGNAACTNAAGSVQIGFGDGSQAVGAVVSEGDSPTVTSVALGNVDGITLGYAAGVPGGEATAKKDDKTYTITGKATGIDAANPLTPVTKDFELEATCP